VSYDNPPPPPPPSYGAPVPGQPMGAPPPNNLVWAILTTLFCCLPLGIVSIVFAAQVNGKFAAGDVAGAQESSNKARQFAIYSAITGVVVAVLYIILVVAVGVGSNS
jgi:predicted secreted protein